MLHRFPQTFFIASTHTRYSHRTLRALECSDEGFVDTKTLQVILQDLQDDGASLFFGFTPHVVKNDDALLETVKEFRLEPVNPIRALRKSVGNCSECFGRIKNSKPEDCFALIPIGGNHGKGTYIRFDLPILDLVPQSEYSKRACNLSVPAANNTLRHAERCTRHAIRLA